MSRTAAEYRSRPVRREQLQPASGIPRHRHSEAYISVVLAGRYQEAGFLGRLNLLPGDVVVHGPFDTHLDHVSEAGADILNLPCAHALSLPPLFRVPDVDRLVRLAEDDPAKAVDILVPAGEVARSRDWPDLLAEFLAVSPGRPLTDFTERMALAPATLSRGFRRAYGVTPSQYRQELRAQRAIALLRTSGTPIAGIAADLGYADQAHLTRSVSGLSKRSPGSWRQGQNRSRPEAATTANRPE